MPTSQSSDDIEMNAAYPEFAANGLVVHVEFQSSLEWVATAARTTGEPFGGPSFSREGPRTAIRDLADKLGILSQMNGGPRR